MYRAGVGGLLELLPVLRTGGVRHMYFYGQALNSSRRCGGHLFFDGCGGPGDIDVQRSRHDSHDRQHAGAERGCDQVRGRETLAAPLIIFGGVGGECGLRGPMNCFAVQVSLIFDLNGDHIFQVSHRAEATATRQDFEGLKESKERAR